MAPVEVNGRPIGSARDAVSLLEPLLAAASGETLAVAYLDAGGGLLGVDTIPGSADGVALPVRRIAGQALRHGAHGLIVAHNHPSGDPTPSQADRAGTRRLVDTLAELGVALHDHLIFAAGECRSFRALGLL